jgi:hypothetical protein
MGRVSEILEKHKHLHEDGADKMMKNLKSKSKKEYTKEEEQAIIKKFRKYIDKVKAKTEASVDEFMEVKQVKNEKAAIAVLKKEGIKWDKKEMTKDLGVYFTFKKEGVAIYDDEFDLLTIF